MSVFVSQFAEHVPYRSQCGWKYPGCEAVLALSQGSWWWCCTLAPKAACWQGRSPCPSESPIRLRITWVSPPIPAVVPYRCRWLCSCCWLTMGRRTHRIPPGMIVDCLSCRCTSRSILTQGLGLYSHLWFPHFRWIPVIPWKWNFLGIPRRNWELWFPIETQRFWESGNFQEISYKSSNKTKAKYIYEATKEDIRCFINNKDKSGNVVIYYM